MSQNQIPLFPLETTHPIPYQALWQGVWSIEENSFRALRQAFESLDMERHLATVQPRIIEELQQPLEHHIRVLDGIALIDIVGVLTKHVASFGGGTSTILVRRLLSLVRSMPEVRGVLLRIDSPGGTVSGTRELARDVARLAETMPVWGFCDDLTASAAYWVASQCTEIHASPTSMVGSIGTYTVVADSSEAARKEGVSVHVIKSGPYKGMGTPGSELTDDHLQDIQYTVNAFNRFFLNAVESGRGLSGDRLAAVSDGRVFMADQAKDLGLVDQVRDLEDSFALMQSKLPPPPPRVLSESERPATYVEVMRLCLDEKFTSEAMRHNWTLPQTTAEWQKRLADAPIKRPGKYCP
jgi:signal peptide peptidase SppA